MAEEQSPQESVEESLQEAIEQEEQSSPAAEAATATPTEEQQRQARELEVAAQAANHLAQENVDYQLLLSGMLASRQLYAMCLYELERLCDRTDFKKVVRFENSQTVGLTNEQQVLFKEILINSAATQAQQPFDENQLLRGLVQTVIPWIQDTVTKHNEQQDKQNKQHARDEEERRVQRPINVQMAIFPEQQEEPQDQLQRQQSVLLIGWQPAVQWVLNRLAAGVVDAEYSNVYQAVHLTRNKPAQRLERFEYVPEKGWEKAATSFNEFQRLYISRIQPALQEPMDLLLIDDVAHAGNDASFMPLVSRVNEAQKKLKQWCKKAGCLLIGGVPLPRHLKDNELHQSEYTTLRTHNVLRGVTAQRVDRDDEQGAYYQIHVGTAMVAEVPVDEVHMALSRKIITP